MIAKPRIPGAPRVQRIDIRVIPDEAVRWQRAADDAGMSLSMWLRNLANAAAPPKKGKR